MPTHRILAGLALAALTLSACGDAADSGGSSSGAARTVKVALTDAGCSPAAITARPGATRFVVSNRGTSKVSEFEILDGKRIIGEAENVVAGIDGHFTVNLKPGTYTTACPGGSSAATGALTVKGAAPARAADASSP